MDLFWKSHAGLLCECVGHTSSSEVVLKGGDSCEVALRGLAWCLCSAVRVWRVRYVCWLGMCRVRVSVSRVCVLCAHVCGLCAGSGPCCVSCAHDSAVRVSCCVYVGHAVCVMCTCRVCVSVNRAC